jgi:hypothetical protein
VRGEDAGAWDFVAIFESYKISHGEFAFVGLQVRFDEDGYLNQAGGGHDIVGVVEERVASAKVFDAEGNFALMGLDQRGQPLIKSGGGVCNREYEEEW